MGLFCFYRKNWLQLYQVIINLFIMFKLKKITNHKMFILILIIVFIGLGIYFITGSNKQQKSNNFKYDPGNVEIIVESNPDGLQQPVDNLQNNATDPNLGAATVQEITGGSENPANQPQSMDKMLRDKEIEIQK